MPNGLACGASTDGPRTPIRVSSSATTKVAVAASIAHRERLHQPAASPTATLIPTDHSAWVLVSGPRGVHRAAAMPQAVPAATTAAIRHSSLRVMGRGWPGEVPPRIGRGRVGHPAPDPVRPRLW